MGSCRLQRGNKVFNMSLDNQISLPEQFRKAIEDENIPQIEKILENEEFNINGDEYLEDIKHPLIVAMEKGNLEIAGLILARTKQHSAWIFRALKTALRQNNLECLKLLLSDEKCSASILNESEREAALTLAAKNGNSEIVKMLLAFPGIDVNIKDAEGCFPLYRAMEKNNPEIVEMLLN